MKPMTRNENRLKEMDTKGFVQNILTHTSNSKFLNIAYIISSIV